MTTPDPWKEHYETAYRVLLKTEATRDKAEADRDRFAAILLEILDMAKVHASTPLPKVEGLLAFVGKVIGEKQEELVRARAEVARLTVALTEIRDDRSWPAEVNEATRRRYWHIANRALEPTP